MAESEKIHHPGHPGPPGPARFRPRDAPPINVQRGTSQAAVKIKCVPCLNRPFGNVACWHNLIFIFHDFEERLKKSFEGIEEHEISWNIMKYEHIQMVSLAKGVQIGGLEMNTKNDRLLSSGSPWTSEKNPGGDLRPVTVFSM